MNFEVNAFSFNQEKIIKKLGLDENGRVQQVIDSSFIHYMRLKMPQRTGMMISQVKNPKGGLVTVETPYAHYMNTGILYVDPITKKGAFYTDTYGFWSRPNTKKIPSERNLNYHGGPDRGNLFAQRTASENFKDIIKEAQKELDRK